MALRHDFTIFCEYLIHADDGKFTFAGTFMNIFGPQLPIVKDKFSFGVQFFGEPGEHFKVTLEGPGLEQPILLGEGEMQEHKTEYPFQLYSGIIAGTLGNATFSQEGIYNLVLRSGNEIVHSRPFGVYLQGQSNATIPVTQ